MVKSRMAFSISRSDFNLAIVAPDTGHGLLRAGRVPKTELHRE